MEAFQRQDWARVEALVDDDVLSRHTASGTPDQVRAALAQYEQVGLDEIVFAGITDAPMLTRIFGAINRGKSQ